MGANDSFKMLLYERYYLIQGCCLCVGIRGRGGGKEKGRGKREGRRSIHMCIML